MATIDSQGSGPDSIFTNIISSSSAISIKVDRCQMVNNTKSVDLGSVQVGEEGKYVAFQMDLTNCPARTDPSCWGMRVFIDDPNNAQLNATLLSPVAGTTTGVAVDVSDNGSFKPIKFNTGDTFTPITFSDYDPSRRTTSINFRAILKKWRFITAGLFQAIGNVRIVFK